MIKYARALFMLALAAICALVLPEVICAEGGLYPWWSGPACDHVELLKVRALFTLVSWAGVAVAVLIWREDW